MSEASLLRQTRRVLEDCKRIRKTLVDGVHGIEWKKGWISLLTLLRTVGYVLDKEDAARDARLSEIVKKEFEALKDSKPAPEIYWEFIDKDRHLLLKEYQFTAGQGTHIHAGSVIINRQTGAVDNIAPGATSYTYTMSSGAYAGQDPRAVADQAIQWWEKYLGQIEAKYRQPHT